MLNKFFRWMRFNPPSSASWDEWGDFEDKYREEAPIRHFIMKKLVLGFQVRVVMRLANIRRWIMYRTTERYHIVDTKLEPGYYDADTLMLHSMFSLLVDYVEVELAWMNIVFDDEAYKKYFGWKRFIPRILRGFIHDFRSKEHGLKHLEWEMTLDDPSLPEEQRCDHQAVRARKVLELYKWWTEVRPARQEIPYPDTGEDNHIFRGSKWRKENPEMAAAISKWARDTNAQEEAWEEEDTEKLVELVKIRRGLWT